MVIQNTVLLRLKINPPPLPGQSSVVESRARGMALGLNPTSTMDEVAQGQVRDLASPLAVPLQTGITTEPTFQKRVAEGKSGMPQSSQRSVSHGP